MSNTFFKGDNTAFGGASLLRININNPNGIILTKAVFKCSSIVKEFENPVFPLIIDFSEEESIKLQSSNVGYLAVWDSKGRKRTATGEIKLYAKEEVV